MTSTTVVAPRVLPALEVEPVESPVEPAEPDVLGLDAAGTLGFVVERRRRQDAAAAEELRAVTLWADLHRVGYVGAADPEIATAVTRRANTAGLTGVTGPTGLAGVEGELRLAGQGAFRIAEFAVAELAAALGLSEPAARAYVGQALELRDRLPRCWDRVLTGDLPAWKARQVADQTIPLSGDAADWVDTHLAGHAHRLSLTRILRAVDAAVLRFYPEEAARRSQAAAEKRGVWLEERLDGTTTLTAVTDTPDAVAFDTALNTVAATLGRLGDPDPHPVRRARAVGVLADPQHTLTLLSEPEPEPRSGPPVERGPGQPEAAAGGQRPATAADRAAGSTTGPAGGPTGGPVLHVHLHTDALTGTVQADGGTPVARVTGTPTPGPRPVAAVERWITGLRPGAVITVTPVVDLTAHVAVDAYEAPRRLVDQLEHRDLTCRFPWCPRTGRLDHDHIQPYQFQYLDDPGGGRPPPGPPGQPGQTSTSNLARLCRFHHRLKTHGGWTYHRTHDTVLTWTSPLGRHYTVDEHGTLPRD
jgi:hypothetical protein